MIIMIICIEHMLCEPYTVRYASDRPSRVIMRFCRWRRNVYKITGEKYNALNFINYYYRNTRTPHRNCVYR